MVPGEYLKHWTLAAIVVSVFWIILIIPAYTNNTQRKVTFSNKRDAQVSEHIGRKASTPATNISVEFKPEGKSVNRSDEFLVPNIVHYIWYPFNNKSEFKYHHMLAMMSASKIIKPDVVMFHTDQEPTGENWDVIKNMPRLKIVKRGRPKKLFGEDIKKPKFDTGDSNVDRVKVVLEYGGIYLDLDVLVLKPFDELRRYPCTIGFEYGTRVCGGIIIGSSSSAFLYIWMNAFLDDYKVDTWAYNTGAVPSRLVKRYPELVHVEKNRLHRPNWTPKELKKIWGPDGFDWSNNYAIHLWYRLYGGTKTPNNGNIKTWKGAFGEMARFILDSEY